MAIIPCDQPTAFKRGEWDQAGAQAYYACQYFQALADTNYIRNLIAVGQAVTQVYFADKQHQIATRTQDRLDLVSNTDLARSGELFAQFQKGIATEDAQLQAAITQLANLPLPDYQAIRNRIAAPIISRYTAAKRKIQECYSVHCQAAACAELTKIEIAQANQISAATEAAYRKEHALYETRKATLQAHLMQVLSFGRGGLGAATALMQGAAAAAEQSGKINPYAGWIQAVNGMANTARSASMQEALSYRGMATNMGNMQAPQSAGSGVQMTQLSGQLTQSGLGDQNGSDVGMFYGFTENPAGVQGDGEVMMNLNNLPSGQFPSQFLG
jgi:hypothetical protein